MPPFQQSKTFLANKIVGNSVDFAMIGVMISTAYMRKI